MNNGRLHFFRFRRLARNERSAFKNFYDFCEKNEKSDDEFYSFGYETFGVILYKFCTWLMNDLALEGIDRILFFSRDGFIIQQAFNIIPGNEKYKNDYCYVSRRSLRVPTLWFSDENRYDAIFPTRYISIEDLLSSIGIEIGDVKDIVEKNGFTGRDLVKGEDIINNPQLANLIDELWPKVIDNSKKEYEAAIGYLEGLELTGTIAVVDIGWRGTMQKYLDKLIKHWGEKVSLRGYYVAINSDHLPGYDMRGFIGNMDGDDEGCDSLRGYVGLIETLFLRTEGSTHSYEKTSNGDIIPVLEQYEYLDGNDLSEEAKSVMEIQSGALQFIRDYVESGESFLDSFSDSLTFHNLNVFAKFPRMSNVRMFCDFRFYNNGTVSHLAGANRLSYYFMHIGQLKNDFYGSRWRIGFMKKLFRIPLPYSSIMDVLMRIVKKGRC